MELPPTEPPASPAPRSTLSVYAWIGWGVFFLFFVSIVKRTNDLRSEVERLKKNAFKEK